jgi:hypothetical protein
VSTHSCAPVAQENVPATQGFGFVSHAPPATQATHAPPLQTWSAPHTAPFAFGMAVSTQVEVPVEQEVVPVTQEVAPGSQAIPAVQETQLPSSQTWSAPQTVPSGSAVGESTQLDVPVLQEVTPVRHGSAFVRQVAPATHETQLPALQTRSVPQPVPFASGVAVSRQVSAPVAHEVTPWRHAFALYEHAVPAVQAPQRPSSQTWFVPHAVPSASGIPVSTQVCAPLSQDVTLWVQAPAMVQSRPATQALQTPVPLQTWPVPHSMPAGFGVAVSTQIDVPVAQEVVPSTQAFGFVSQVAPATQATHAPPLQTRSVPQLVPSGSRTAVSRHCCVPAAQEVTPVRHGSGLGPQAASATQATHAPPLQTWSVPHDVPFAICVPVSMQVCVPVAQENVPATHGFGLVAHVPPDTHAEQRPPLQTASVPHEVPFGSAVAESTQTDVPVVQDVTPVKQGSGLSVQATPAMHALQRPPLQTWSVPQPVPFGSVIAGSSMQTCVPSEPGTVQETIPAVQGEFGFVVQEPPATQVRQTPALQT